MTSLRAAETAFRWVMRAYPASFRRAHGLALFELFRDEAREAYAARGSRGVLLAVVKAAGDTIENAPAAWHDSYRHRSPEALVSPADHRPRACDRRVGRLVHGLAHDVRLAIRRFRQAPAFTAVAVLMLAVGLGATTTVFSFMNAVLLRPLAERDPDRVVRVVARVGTGAVGAAARRFSYRDFVDYRERTTTVHELSGVNLATLLLTADNRTDQILGEIASGQYLALLGAHASQGRLLTALDDSPAAAPVVVISDAFWRRRFGGGPVVGERVWLNRMGYTIVGVAAPSVMGSFIAAPVDAWIPIESSGQALGVGWRQDRSQRTLAVLGRLRDGVTRVQAQTEMQTIAESLARDVAPYRHPEIDVLPGTLATGDQRRLATMFLSLLLGLVTLVLVIACANVGNLLLARVFGRRRELAVRLALGASRARLARMITVESLLLAAMGGIAALAIASSARGLFANISALPTLTLRLDVRPDMRVVAFAAAAALAAGTVLAVVGALHAMKPEIAPALKEESLGSMGSRSSMRLRGGLASVQVVVSLLLLVGAALFARSVQGAAAIDLGFDPTGVVVLDIDASGGRTNLESLATFESVLTRLEAVPQVQAAAMSSRAPLDSSTPLVRVSAQGPIARDVESDAPIASLLIVSPHFFDVVRTPVVLGRSFAQADDATRPPVAIVNETLAARLWPHGDALGRRVWVDATAMSAPSVVVGIARNAKYRTLGEEAQEHVYLPFAQQPRRGMALLVRSSGPPDRTIQTAQQTLQSIDSNLQGFFARTLQQHVDVSLLPVRFAAGLTSAIAACALAFAAVGLYSLVSFVVAERTSEIGLRMALGADQGAVLRLIIGAGMRLAAIGLAVGIPTAIVSSRLLSSLLYGVSPVDPAVFGAVTLVIVLVTFTACYLPARRAVRADPLTALRRS